MTASATSGTWPDPGVPGAGSAARADADELIVPPLPATPATGPEPAPPEPTAEPDREPALPGLPPAEAVPRGWMPRQIGGIWFGLGVAIGWLGGIVFQYASLWTEEGFPLSSEHTLLVLLAAGLVLTCIRRTCSFGIGALVSLPFAPLLVLSRLVDLLSPLLLLG